MPGRTVNHRRKLLVCALLAAATLGTFWPVLHNGFINYDDPEYVTENPQVRAGLTGPGVEWAFTTGHAANWHPLTWISHMIDVQVFGLNPAAHHAVNLGLHVLNTLLLFLLLARMTGATWRSGFVAAVFALHPMHVQSVAWVAERKDVLSAFFFLLTLLAYAEYTNAECGVRNAEYRARIGRAYLFYGLSVFTFALGLLSKPMLVTVPFVLLLLDVWPLGRLQTRNQKSDIRHLLVEKIPFFALSAGSGVLTLHFQRAGGAVEALQNLSLADRLANAVEAYVRYFGKLFWPSDLSIFYPPLAPQPWQVWAGAALLFCFSAVCLIALKRQGPTSAAYSADATSPNLYLAKPAYLAVGWFWFVGMLVPVIGLVQVGSQSIADRYTYLPYIGLSLALTWLIADCSSRSKEAGPAPSRSHVVTLSRSNALRSTTGATISLALLTVLAFDTNRQVRYWRDSETLFRHALAVTPDNAIARFSLGKALVETGRMEAGIAELSRALELKPGFGKARGELASALSAEGKYAEAIQQYQLALQTDPNLPEALNNLAWLRATSPNPALRNGAEAVQLAQRACELTRYQRTIFIGTLAAAYAEDGRFSEAIAAAEKAREHALAWHETGLAERNQQLLELYRNKQPFHEPPR